MDWGPQSLSSLPWSLTFITGLPPWHSLAHGYKLACTEIEVSEEQTVGLQGQGALQEVLTAALPLPPMSVEVGASGWNFS